jgi:hypothetical protein
MKKAIRHEPLGEAYAQTVDRVSSSRVQRPSTVPEANVGLFDERIDQTRRKFVNVLGDLLGLTD